MFPVFMTSGFGAWGEPVAVPTDLADLVAWLRQHPHSNDFERDDWQNLAKASMNSLRLHFGSWLTRTSGPLIDGAKHYKLGPTSSSNFPPGISSMTFSTRHRSASFVMPRTR